MVEHDGEFVLVQLRDEVRDLRAAPAEVQLLGRILPPDQIKPAVQQNAFILQYGHAVFLKLRDQVVAGVAAPAVRIQALVVIAERKVDAVRRVELTQSAAGWRSYPPCSCPRLQSRLRSRPHPAAAPECGRYVR